MPSYICTTRTGRLSDEQRSRIARAITRAHHEVTGAPAYFARVQFDEVDPGAPFIGGAPLDHDHMMVCGAIRDGRDTVTRAELNARIADGAAMSPVSSVWACGSTSPSCRRRTWSSSATGCRHPATKLRGGTPCPPPTASGWSNSEDEHRTGPARWACDCLRQFQSRLCRSRSRAGQVVHHSGRGTGAGDHPDCLAGVDVGGVVVTASPSLGERAGGIRFGAREERGPYPRADAPGGQDRRQPTSGWRCHPRPAPACRPCRAPPAATGGSCAAGRQMCCRIRWALRSDRRASARKARVGRSPACTP